ncbi:UNVERIFIED_ORG: hypothetical protein JN05_03501 [Zoogloea ramigera]
MNEIKRATAVAAQVVIPQALSLSDFTMGTSVFAAGQVGLELVRIALATAGLPKAAIDEITLDHVTITAATVTYMLPCVGRSSPSQLKKLIHQHAMLIGLGGQSRMGEFHYSHAKNAAENQVGSYPRGSAISVDSRLVEGYVLIDVILSEPYLKTQGWDSVASWKDAYDENRYGRVFDKVVRGILQLDGPRCVYPGPSQQIMDQLGLRNEHILRDYMRGKDSATFSSFAFVRTNIDASRKKSWTDARKVILAQTGIDINKKWTEYQWHFPDSLAAQLKYPGDYSPEVKAVSTCFCSDAWPALLARLSQEYNAV